MCSAPQRKHLGFGATSRFFTSVSGTAPNRIFNIEWRVVYFADHNMTANFEARLYENDPSQRFDIVFGTIQPGSDQLYVSGVQGPAGAFTQDFCATSAITPGRMTTYTLTGCGTPTPTLTPCPSCTSTPTNTRLPAREMCGRERHRRVTGRLHPCDGRVTRM